MQLVVKRGGGGGGGVGGVMLGTYIFLIDIYVLFGEKVFQKFSPIFKRHVCGYL